MIPWIWPFQDENSIPGRPVLRYNRMWAWRRGKDHHLLQFTYYGGTLYAAAAVVPVKACSGDIESRALRFAFARQHQIFH